MPDAKLFKIKLEEITPDERNANLGTQRGSHIIEESVRKLGIGRSIVVDKEGRAVAGNKTLQAMIDAGITEAVVIETDGDTAVIHKRTDWDLKEVKGPARQYAHVDNRSSELSYAPDYSQIAEDLQDGVDLSLSYLDDELKLILESVFAVDLDELPDDEPDDKELWPIIRIQVDADTFKQYMKLMAAMPGEADNQRFRNLLNAASIGVNA